MTKEEAIKILRENKEANGKKESPYSVFDWIKAHDMAIRSLEACKQIQAMVFDHLGDWDSDADEVIISIKDVLKEVEE